jgi:pilus assembly protein CpaB
MDRRFLTVLGVSLVFALVVSSVFYQMTARSSGAAKVDATNQKDMVVATRPLSVGVMVKPADVKIAKIGTDSFPKGAFTKVEDVLDRPVISNILLDEPVLEGRLAAKGSGLGLAPTIPVGMRAVSVRVNDVAGVAGFVLPGMHVDVLVTGRPPNGDDDYLSAKYSGALGGPDHSGGCAGAGDAGSDGDAAGGSGTGRDADAGR